MSLVAILACAAGVVLSAQPIELRSSMTTPPGRILSIDLAGVTLAAPELAGVEGAGQPRVRSTGAPGGAGAPPAATIITWDRIRAVHGEAAEEAEPFREIADKAWRARTRLERGDALAAEPLFEELFAHYREQGALGSATSAVIAEGLLRCRIRRGAHISAIEPWLALLQASDALPTLMSDWARSSELSPVIDQATGLAPGLPPMWLPWPAVEAFARANLSEGDDDPTRIISRRGEALAALYIHAAQMDAGLESTLPHIRSNDPGVHLVLAIVQSRSPDAEQRQRARQRLEERLRPRGGTAQPTPAWIEIWCRAAIGRSLIRETQADLKQLGILQLLHLPARFATSHPYLVGLALAEASVALRDLGDARSAEILAAELADQYPTHAARDWQRLRHRGPLPRPSPAPQNPSPVDDTQDLEPPERR